MLMQVPLKPSTSGKLNRQSMKPKSTKPTFYDIVGMIVGTLFSVVIGFLLGAAFAVGIGVYSQAQNPEDASAGSVAIIGIFTGPLFAFVGGLFGLVSSVSFFMKRRERINAAKRE
jgi:ABC-type phosphate transport system permease subunit